MNRLLKQKRKMMANHWGLCFCCLFLGVFAGCGGAERSDSSVVSPPLSGQIEKAAPPAVDPPGDIEMPSGEIPTPTTGDPPKTEGGIQMPQGAKVPDPAESTSTGCANVPADSDASATVDLQYGTWEEIQSVARSSGRITVVDLWSLACEPCVKEFPGLVRLHETLGSSVQCIAVDLDFDGRKSRPPEHYEDQVVSFLRDVGASGFPTYISQTPSDDVFAAMKLASIPAVLIYNAKGELAKAFVDAGETAGFTYQDDVIPLVTKLAG
jgi:thiol-disulfide isomerase/thioredoxin